MSIKHQIAGRKGGLATMKKYGVEYLIAMGRANCHKGGRPKLPTLRQLKAEQAAKYEENLKGGELPNDLNELKKLFRLRQKSIALRINMGEAEDVVDPELPPKGAIKK